MMFKVTLQAQYGKDAEITAVCFYAICSQLQISVQPQQYPHKFTGIRYNKYKCFSTFDMLIVSDFYWDIITGDIKRRSANCCKQ